MGYEVDTTGSVPVVTSSGPPSEPNIASQEEVRERLPDLFNSQTGERLGIIYGPEGGYRAEQILGENPEISDASLDYLRQNRDVFLDAKNRIQGGDDVTYEDVAKQHFDLFGRHEDRKGMDGLMSMPEAFETSGELTEEPTGEPIGDMVGDIAGGIMSPDTPEVEDDVSQIGKPIIAETDPELGSDEFHHVDASRQTEIERKARRDNERQYQPGREPTDDKGRPLYAPADTIGDFDRRDVELFARSLNKAKGVDLDITDFFEEKEDGSWDVISNEYNIGFQKPTKESRKNKTGPVKLAGSLNKDGIPVSRALAKNIINARLSLIDETKS